MTPQSVLRLSILAVLIVYTDRTQCLDQPGVNYIARYLEIYYDVVDNIKHQPAGFSYRITLRNSGPNDIDAAQYDKVWSIYFSHIRVMQPADFLVDGGNYIKREGSEIGDSGINLYHVNGVLHRISPTDNFKGIASGKELVLELFGSAWTVSRTDIMPNWYVVGGEYTQARAIANTVGQSLDFVGNFDTKEKYKRNGNDKYDPYTPEDRYNMFPDKQNVGRRVIPKVVRSELTNEEVKITRADWIVVYNPEKVPSFDAKFLADKLGINAVKEDGTILTNRFIKLVVDPNMNRGDACKTNPETYSILTQGTWESIVITATEKVGVFWGIQTLLALVSHGSGSVPTGYVEDCPRYAYRGMHVDVGRNFFTKESVLMLLDAMAMYKLNKFHFHITDDEGWRLEIPGLPELTEVGAQRCHDLSGDKCIMPQLGSLPASGHPGSGFYSVADYKEILQFADDRGIEVIPEFDMPGHAHAAINAMLARYRKYEKTDMAKATQFLISDLNDTSRYISVQTFIDNAIDPCMDSTYDFVQHIITEVKKMHADIQPLKVFNFGGDEVPKTAWVNSTACMRMQQDVGKADLKEYFVQKVSELAHEAGLGLAAWEDGVMFDGSKNMPFNLSDISTPTVYAYAWNNIWEWGSGARAYKLANAGYQTVISHGTNFYFDHPHEPDPEERGYYWATRFTNTRKVFGFMPDTVYENIEYDLFGNKITKESVCSDASKCTPLEKAENVVGIQGQLWSETVRTRNQIEGMIFPRVVALAERAWHKADWESETDTTKRDAARQADWEEFANILGQRELTRLDKMDIDYHILPPGAKLEHLKLKFRSEFPGLRPQVSRDGGKSWCDVESEVDVSAGDTIHMATKSADGRRFSRITQVKVPSLTSSAATRSTRELLLPLMVTLVACLRLAAT